jgi:hypothetical protein
MTLAEIKGAIKDLCNLTSTDADTRVGKSVNRHYKRVTSSLGMDATRFVTRSQSTTNGVRTVTFTSIEHIDRVIDATDSNAIRPLVETSVDTLRNEQPGTGQPTRYAIQSVTGTSVTILIDTLPQVTYSLQADGTATLSDLTGSDVPAIPESYHDILTFSVIAEELLKKEKVALAREYASGDENRPGRAEKLLAALRFQLADSHSYATRQGDRTSTVGSGSGSGGSGSVGGTAYTQTALLTFDRGAGIVPFAVARTDAPYVVNLGAEFLGNITTSRLIGRATAGTGESEQITLSQALDFIGSAAQGDLLYRGAAAWARLGAGTSGQFLQTLGASANPAWSTGVQILDRDVTVNEVVSTAVETTVYTFSVPANTLSTNRAIRLTLLGTYLNNSGSNRDLTPKVTFGGTTVTGTATTGWGSSASRRLITLEVVISAFNATNAQRAAGKFRVGPAGSVDGTLVAATLYDFYHNALAIDTTIAQTLAVTWTHSFSASTISFICECVQVELL